MIKRKKKAINEEVKDKGRCQCPFDKTLNCEYCRLYVTYLGSGGKRDCAIILAADR